MQILGVLLAAYVATIWIGWVRRGPEPIFAVAAVAISAIVLWSAWDIWRADELPSRQIALFFWSCLTATLMSMVLRRRGRKMSNLLILLLLMGIPRELELLFRYGYGEAALSMLKLHPSVGIILSLRVAAATNLVYVIRTRKDLIEPPKPEVGEVFG